MKDEKGNIKVYGTSRYLDGSLQADLPLDELKAAFQIKHTIVSQVNFHVVPFIHKHHSPPENSLYWKTFSPFY